MTLRQIEFFIAVCESSSFSKAAQRLFVSQQTISKSIRELEMELKTSLFVRSSTGVEPNSYGHIVYEELRIIQDKIAALPLMLEKLGTKTKEVINMVVAYGAFAALTKDVFDHFQSLHPEVDLRLSDEPDVVVEEKLISGEADIGIGVGPIDAVHFESYLLKKEPMYLCVHKSHPLFGNEQITMDMLRHHAFLNMSPLFKGYHNLANSCRYAGFDVKLSFTSNEIITLIEMAQDNEGLLTLPGSKIQSRSWDMRCIAFPDEYYNYSLFLIRRLGQRETIGVKALKEHLLGVFGDPGS